MNILKTLPQRLYRHLITGLVLFSLIGSFPLHATEIKLVSASGQTEPLSNYIGNGQWVIVNTWSPSCSACVAELPRLKQFIERNPNISVLGVTLDFPSFGYGKMDLLQNFLATEPLSYPLFLADIEQVSELIGRWLVGIPSISIFHPDGQPLVTWPGVIEINEIETFIANYRKQKDPLRDGFEDW